MGFFLGDFDIAYTLRPSTVPSWALLVIALLVPLLAVAFAAPLPRWTAFWRVARIALLGAFATALVTDTAKNASGRLRPYFLVACDLDVSRLPSPSNASHIPQMLLGEDVCRGQQAEMDEARRSFPSGHASLSFYGAGFVAFLLTRAHRHEARWNSADGRDCTLPRALLQTLCFILAAFVAASRIADHKHHISDVLVGAALGSVFAWIAVFYVLPKTHIQALQLASWP
jgi:phosphatidate phosphatase